MSYEDRMKLNGQITTLNRQIGALMTRRHDIELELNKVLETERILKAEAAKRQSKIATLPDGG